MARPRKADALTRAEISRRAREKQGGVVRLTVQARADLTALRAAAGDRSDSAAVARIMREAASRVGHQ